VTTRVALIVHPVAAQELAAAEEWYATRDGREGVHKCIVRGFPFTIAYKIHEKGDFVLAIAHARRRRAYWFRRLPRR
jgi:hypothetical protein